MTITRNHLRQALQDTGEFSYRQARLIIKELFNILVDELDRHKKLELSIGTLEVYHPQTRRAYRFGKIVTIGKKVKVHFRKNPYVEPITVAAEQARRNG